MSGLSTLLFTLGLVVALALVYGAGMTGWIIGSLALLGGWVAILVLKAVDPGAAAVQVMAGIVTMSLALRWVFRHQRWSKRMTKDRQEADEKQQQVRGVVDDLKARIAVKVTEVDKGLKQYELVKRLAEAVSWEEMSPSLDKALKHFSGQTAGLFTSPMKRERFKSFSVVASPRIRGTKTWRRRNLSYTPSCQRLGQTKVGVSGPWVSRSGVCMIALVF